MASREDFRNPGGFLTRIPDYNKKVCCKSVSSTIFVFVKKIIKKRLFMTQDKSNVKLRNVTPVSYIEITNL